MYVCARERVATNAKRNYDATRGDKERKVNKWGESEWNTHTRHKAKPRWNAEQFRVP